jgi:hypothetical protein
MSSTRSGNIYNTRFASRRTPIEHSTQDTQVRKSPRFAGKTHEASRPTFFEPITSDIIGRNAYPTRSNRTAFPAELIREYCNDSDNDSTSDYGSEDDEDVQQYNYMTPKYEVNIDFDGASAAWRANKRRVGESWVYKLNPKHPENINYDIIDDAVKSVTSHVATRSASNVASSVASRVKQRHTSGL